MTDAPRTREDADTLWHLGWLVQMRLDAADTGGALAIADELGRAGLATPLHRHSREDETLIVVDGEVTAWIGDEVRTARAGDAVWLPRDVPHAFRVESETARVFMCGDRCPSGWVDLRRFCDGRSDSQRLPR